MLNSELGFVSAAWKDPRLPQPLKAVSKKTIRDNLQTTEGVIINDIIFSCALLICFYMEFLWNGF